MIIAIGAGKEREKTDKRRGRKVDIFALLSPNDEPLKWSVYGVERSGAVSPLVSKTL